MVQVNRHDVVAATGDGVVEGDGPYPLNVRVTLTFQTSRQERTAPASGTPLPGCAEASSAGSRQPHASTPGLGHHGTSDRAWWESLLGEGRFVQFGVLANSFSWSKFLARAVVPRQTVSNPSKA